MKRTLLPVAGLLLALGTLGSGCDAGGHDSARGPTSSPVVRTENPPGEEAPALPVRALAWEAGHPERKAWSDELRRAVAAHLDSLEKAADFARFAPNYRDLPTARRIDIWASLFVAIARFESGFDTHEVYRESFGQDSVGLLQLSYEDQPAYGLEPLDREARSLEDPLVNIRCGVKILARLVVRDKVIATGSSLRDGRGGARYWSTLWRGEGHHIVEIQDMVRKEALAE